jgi:hypothetical protein
MNEEPMLKDWAEVDGVWHRNAILCRIVGGLVFVSVSVR